MMDLASTMMDLMDAVLLCALAYCFALFVPVCLSVLRMSLNKMCFFICALFIILSLGVHFNLFLSISDFTSFGSSSFVNRISCLPLLHEVVWDLRPYLFPNESLLYRRSWDWDESGPVSKCDFKKLSRADTSELLNESWFVVAGDSQARFAALSLLNLVLDYKSMKAVRYDLFKTHSNYQNVFDEIGMKFEFYWAPHVSNLTDLIIEFNPMADYPDILIMSSGLWHMLHMNNASDYGISLQSLRSTIFAFPPEFRIKGHSVTVHVRSQYMFWLGFPNLVNSMLLNTEQRLKMTNETINAYDRELHRSKILRQYLGPMILLDIDSLSRGCGMNCTEDGMHYNEVVYDAAIQIMLNALLVLSYQKM